MSTKSRTRGDIEYVDLMEMGNVRLQVNVHAVSDDVRGLAKALS